MEFTCAELLSFSHNYNLWGDALHPNSTQSFTIKGSVTGDFSKDLVSGVWTGMNSLISSLSGESIPVVVNSVNIGTGRVVSLNFDAGTDTRRKYYTASIEIYRHAGSGLYDNFGNFTYPSLFSGSPSGVYSYFNTTTGRYIDNFNYSVNIDVIASGKFTIQKDIQFNVNSGIYSDYGVSAASYASTVINGCKNSFEDSSVLSIFYPNFYKTLSGITYTQQSFNNITNEVNYSESFRFQSGLNYIWDYSHSVDYSNGGFSISENGTILSTELKSYKSEAAEIAWSGIDSTMFSRVSGLYQSYTGIFNYTGGCTLKNLPESSSLVKDKCAGSIQYSRNYSNNIFNSNSGYTYSYQDTVELDDDGFIRISENGEFKAIQNKYPSGFDLVLSGYRGKTGEIYSRINSLYTSTTGNFYRCYVNTGISLESEEITMREHEAIVSYSKSYSDNIKSSGNDIYNSISHVISLDEPTHIINYFPIPYDSILAQRAIQSTRGTLTNTISLVSRESVPLQNFINTATGMIRFPDGDDIILKDYSYQFSPLKNNFSLKASYTYTDYASPTDILI